MRSVISSRLFSPFRKSAALELPDEDGEVVANRQGMDDIVGNEDNGNALLTRLKDDTQDVCGLLDPQSGGGLVKDQKLCSEVNGSSDCQSLTLASRETADETIPIVDPRDPEFAHFTHRDLIGMFPVEDCKRTPTFRRFGTDKKRSSYAHQRKRPAELMNGRDAVIAGIARAVERDGLAVDLHPAGGRLVDAGEES